MCIWWEVESQSENNEQACLSEGFTAVNRHHGQGNPYKGFTLKWGWITGSELLSIVI